MPVSVEPRTIPSPMQPVKIYVNGQFRTSSTGQVAKHIDPTTKQELANMRSLRLRS